MTRADILQRLADALHANPPSCGTRGCATEGAVAALAALRALAREPGGAEAVAEAVGLTVEVWPGCRCALRDACDCAARIVPARKERGT